jgi:hypothetical protein
MYCAPGSNLAAKQKIGAQDTSERNFPKEAHVSTPYACRESLDAKRKQFLWKRFSAIEKLNQIPSYRTRFGFLLISS